MKASTIFAFLGGAALGAMAALLLAPDSGRRTRKKLKRLLKKYGIKLSSDELNELINRLNLQNAKKSIKNLV